MLPLNFQLLFFVLFLFKHSSSNLNSCSVTDLHHVRAISTYRPYEEMVEIISALNGDAEEAVKLLTRHYWNCQAASEQVI